MPEEHTPAETERIGIYGGSFDPPHVGHVLLAHYLLMTAQVSRLLVVPTFEHPLGKPLGRYSHRLQMCRLAFAHGPSVEVSTLEQELGGPSLTLRLVKEVARRHPGASLRLVIGADILGERPRWHRFEDIEDIAPPLVVGRGGSPVVQTGSEAIPASEIAPVSMPEVSSSELRQRLAQGRETRAHLPRSVLTYIEAHGLYDVNADPEHGLPAT